MQLAVIPIHHIAVGHTHVGIGRQSHKDVKYAT